MAKQQQGENPSDEATPSQSPGPSPSGPAAAASSPGSAPVSPSEGAPGFIGDPGPEFNPEGAAPPPPEPEQLQPVQLIEWEEDTVRALLTMKGRAMHAGIGVAERDWHYTEVDLAAIAPPLTRIANRYEPIQRLAVHADPLLLLFAFGGYGVRSLEERAAVMRQLAEESDVAEVEPMAPGEVEGLQQPQQPPTPATAPRQTQWSTSVQGPPPPPAAVVQEAPPAPEARPGEADVDPQALNWDVPRQ